MMGNLSKRPRGRVSWELSEYIRLSFSLQGTAGSLLGFSNSGSHFPADRKEFSGSESPARGPRPII